MIDDSLTIVVITSFFILFFFLLLFVKKKNKEEKIRTNDIEEKEDEFEEIKTMPDEDQEHQIKGIEEKEDGYEKIRKKYNHSYAPQHLSGDSSGYAELIIFAIVLVGSIIAGLFYGFLSLLKGGSKKNDETE